MINEKKEKIVITLGFFLILIVILITLFRSNLFENKGSSNDLNLSGQSYSKPDYPTINVKDLNKKILLSKGDTSLVLLDVRTFDSYAREHIVDSINITPDEFPLNSKIDLHKQVIVIGADENDENIKKTVDELKKENFKDYLVLLGGMILWKQTGGSTVTYGDPTSFVDQSKVYYVEPEKLNEALKQNVPMFIIDVRTAEEYSKGHIPGAINIPSDDLEKRRREIKEKRVVVVGISELHEFQSSVKMYDMLLVSPFVLKGAMPKWEEKGYPIAR